MYRLQHKLWYEAHWGRWLLSPFAYSYQGVMALRRRWLRRFCRQTFSVPIIVVGNLTVGGVGKTPLVAELAKQCQARGLRVGIVSRGYKSRVKQVPYAVRLDDPASLVGDEPLLLAQKTQCPVVISPKRVDAVRYLMKHFDPQVILSDDGLQHEAMDRQFQIVVVDGARGFGNELCLPAGPLRESVNRLGEVDVVVVNSACEEVMQRVRHLCDAYKTPVCSMSLIPGSMQQIKTKRPMAIASIEKPIAALAGIGYPARFFATLTALQLAFKTYVYPDHYRFTEKDIKLIREKSIVMTEKDAVKCFPFATEKMFFLPVDAEVSEPFWEILWSHGLFDSTARSL